MNMSLGKSIRMVRNLKDIKQQDLADSLGVTSSYISQLESDKRSPSWETLKRLASCLGVNVTLLAMLSESSDPLLAPYVPLIYSAMLQGRPLLKREEDQ